MVWDSLESGSLRRREISTVMVKSLIPSRSTDDLRRRGARFVSVLIFDL